MVWLVVGLCALMLPALFPFWNVDYFMSADSPLHLWRLYELDRALRAGILYPRWAYDLYFGYGVPLFNFYPPVTYYLAETLHVIGFSIPNAIKLAFALAVLIGGAGMFLFSRDVWRSALKTDWETNAAALLSAVAFVYAPYFLTDIYIRGAMAETFGLAFLPFFFWALRRVLGAPNLGGLILAGIAGAALMLSHNLTVYIVAPVVILYAALRVLALETRARGVRAVGFTIGAGILALTLSAFYWLPVVSELRWVYIGNSELTHTAFQQTIAASFKPLAQLVQANLWYEYPEDTFPLGAMWTLLAVGGFASSLYLLKRHARFEIIFWGIVTLGAALAVTDLVRPLWLSVPQLWVLQFTWRLTVLVTLGGALAMGAWVVLVVRLTRRRVVRAAAVLALMFVLIASAVFNLRAKPFAAPMPSANAPQVLARYEMNSRTVGMSSDNEYLPATVQMLPDPYPRRVRALDDLTDTQKNPPLLQIQMQDAQPTNYNLRVNAPQATQLTFDTFYYPDWQVWLDNQNVSARPGAKLGLLMVDVPEGQHEIRVIQGSLPARDAGNFLTLASILFVFAWALYDARHSGRAWRLPVALLALLLLIFLIPQTRVLAATPAKIEPAQLQFDDQLNLLGWQSENAAPNLLRVQFIWQVKQLTRENHTTRVELVNAQGDVTSSRAQWARYGVADERYWIPNEIVRDTYDLPLPNELPAGAYTIRLARGEMAPVSIGTITLDAQHNATIPPTIPQHIDARLGDAIQLRGFDASPLERVHPGDSMPLTLYWSADKEVLEDYWVFVQLLDKDGKLVAQADGLPNNGFTPPLLWMPNEIIADRRVLQIPATISPGQYRLIVGLYRFRDLSRLPVSNRQGALDDDFVVLSQIKIPADTPFTPGQRLQYLFGNAIELRGATISAQDAGGKISARATNGEPLRLNTTLPHNLNLTLEWHALSQPEKAYTTFLHLVDANGNVVRQQDNPPVNGNYPTTLWEKSERVIDTYQLNLEALAPGEYTLRLGVYDSNTGERLPVTNAQGAELPDRELELARVTIVQ